METELLNIPVGSRKLQSRLEGTALDWEEIQMDWDWGLFEHCLAALRPETGLANSPVGGLGSTAQGRNVWGRGKTWKADGRVLKSE